MATSARLSFYFLVILPTMVMGEGVWAEEKKPQPVEITADAMHYDQKKDVADAEGSVDIVQGKRSVHSDKAIYDKRNNKVRAEGNVQFIDETGDIFYASDVELWNNMRDGKLTQLTAKLADDSNISATQGERHDKTVLVLEDATYTPCTICTKTKKPRKPMWQLRSKKVTIDQKKQVMRHKHAFFDFYGVPVFYTPYFSHPTPNANRKSGFLTPRYSHDSLLGNTLKVPYYLNLAPNYDATLTPFFTTKEGLVMEGGFRQLLQNGQYSLRGSFTRPGRRDDTGKRIEGRKTRGHIEGEGVFHVTDLWDAGFTGKRASDDTYLRKYDFGDEDTLTTRVYAEKVKGRDYTVVQGLSFQGLNAEDDPGKTPLILPYSQMHMESAPGFKGSRWMMDADALVLSRKEGNQSRRVSLGGGWNLPFITDAGHVFTFRSGVRGDIYSIDRENDPLNPSENSSIESRMLPEAELDWSLPLVQENLNSRVILEPVVNMIVSPYGGNPEEIPNEDSQVTELSDSNLFSSNRYTGIDRIENGPRVNYGVRGGVHGNKGQHVDFLFGQNYRTHKDSNLLPSSGLDKHFSDYVGRVGFRTSEMFDIGYRFRLDRDDLTVKRSEVMAGWYYAPVRLDLDYVNIDASASTITGEPREELYGRFAWDVNHIWTVATDARRDLTDDGGWVTSSASLIFHGDCANFTTSWVREFTRDRDIEPSTSFLFQIQLKNLN